MTYVISRVNQFSGYLQVVSKNALREAVSSQVVRLLRKRREEQGISMNVLAQRAGLSQSTVSLVERGLRVPNLDTLLRIAEVLGVDLGVIIQKAIAAAKRAEAS